MVYMLFSVLLALSSEDATASRSDHGGRLKRSAMRYFEVWNQHDVPGLKNLLAAEATLRDWEVEKKGREEVANANSKIFATAPGIKIEVLTVHVATATRTVACKILVKPNNNKSTELKVVDIITFNEQGKILSVRAYKG